MTPHLHAHAASAPAAVLEVSLTSCANGTGLTTAEHFLTNLPGVTSVHLDRTRAVAHLGYDP